MDLLITTCLIGVIAALLGACGVEPSTTLQTCTETCEYDLRQWVDFCTSSFECDDEHPRDNADGCHDKRAVCMVNAYDLRVGCYSSQCSEPSETLQTTVDVWRGVVACLGEVPIDDVSICYEVGSR